MAICNPGYNNNHYYNNNPDYIITHTYKYIY